MILGLELKGDIFPSITDMEAIPRWNGGYRQEGWSPSELPIFELAMLFTAAVYYW